MVWPVLTADFGPDLPAPDSQDCFAARILAGFQPRELVPANAKSAFMRHRVCLCDAGFAVAPLVRILPLTPAALMRMQGELSARNGMDCTAPPRRYAWTTRG